MRIKSILFLLSTISLCEAQTFVPNGTAIDLGDGCFQFQVDGGFRSGAVWSGTQVDFSDTIDITLEFIPDCAGGMDGMAIVFQPIGSSEGALNDRMGYRGLAPSLAVELDLFSDNEDNDPVFNHLAIMADGVLDHDDPRQLSPPVPLMPGWDRLPDCTGRIFRVVWEPVNRRIQVYFDCHLRIDRILPEDLDILSGKVFWGYTVGLTSFVPFFRVCKDIKKFTDLLPDTSFCPGEQITLTAPITGDSYKWSTGQPLVDFTSATITFKPDSNELVLLQVRDTCGLITEEEVNIVERSIADLIDIGPPDTLLCPGDSIRLSPMRLPGALYRWSDSLDTPERLIQDSGEYRLNVTQGLCEAADTIEVFLQKSNDLYLGEDTVVCLGTELSLDTKLPRGYEVVWQNGHRGPELKVMKSGRYLAIARSNCAVLEDEIEVTFIDCLPLYIPNAFSPNGDGINDVFLPVGPLGTIEVIRFVVADRWGNLVHRESNVLLAAMRGWDGNIGDQEANGTYIYYLELIALDGSTMRFSGSVSILQ